MSRREVNDADQMAAIEAYRAAAQAEADAHFDDRTLDVQRHKILERLAHLGQPAKVIRFPVTPRGPIPATNINVRWITAAAAAGLIIGLASGQLVHVMRPAPRLAARPEAVVSPQSEPHASPYVAAVNALTQDDGLLGEIDVAVQLRSAAELRALDELTPFREPR